MSDPEAVLENVKDDSVSVERAERNYGVVIEETDPEICAYEIDHDATEGRERIFGTTAKGGSKRSSNATRKANSINWISSVDTA